MISDDDATSSEVWPGLFDGDASDGTQSSRKTTSYSGTHIELILEFCFNDFTEDGCSLLRVHARVGVSSR